ncbi:hypothetical protein [Enterobacter hormaechei]|uniref:hypothetical protein n=1 Tax=Enterobacter hormaechei TaxID=158836 RepID=UPI0033148F9F
MSDSLNNKELVAVGHQFAKALSSDTALMDIAKMLTRLAERLDCTTAALREMTKQRDALGAEIAGLKQAAEFATADDMWIEQTDGMLDYRYVDWYVDVLKAAMETPATDAFMAEVRAQGVEMFAKSLKVVGGHEHPYSAVAKEFAAKLHGNRRDLTYPVDPQIAAYEKIMDQAMPDGWGAVPVEATLDMVKAGAKAASDGFLILGVFRAMLASAPDFREISNSSTKHFRENAETSTNCPRCSGRGSYHCPQMLGTVECECTLPAAPQQEVK